MIELERHIEILLLNNDCVIVPGLGGFMAHHIEAHYDEEDGVFLPPQRTIGFNPQLKLNDALLAQSYIEAYDISFPEAVRRIEGEVAELRQHLDNEGRYELNNLGVLKVNDEGKLEFTPCEAGILTPELYGLSSFEMPLLGIVSQDKPEETIIKKEIEEEAKAPVLTIDESHEESDTKEEQDDDHAIVIKMSWIRNVVAVAAALLAFFMMTTPVSNTEFEGISKSQITLPVIHKDSNQKDKLDSQVVKEILQHQDTLTLDTATNHEPTPQPAETTVPEIKSGFCIVLASQVSEHNAEEFVSKLQKQGIDDARVYINNNIRRVICGNFETESEAYQQLKQIHEIEPDAWVYRMK